MANHSNELFPNTVEIVELNNVDEIRILLAYIEDIWRS